MKKLFFFLLFLLLLVGVVSATKPVPEVQENSAGYQVEYDKVFDHQYGVPLVLNFHVFDISSGMAVNSGISCDLAMYNSSGGITVFDTVIDVVRQYDYEFSITADNFANIEMMSYVVQCNDSQSGGFVSVPLNFNTTGQNQDSLYFLILIFLIPILIGVFSLVGSHILGEEHDVMKLGLFLFSLTCFFASLWVSTLIVAALYPLFTELINFLTYVTWFYALVLAVIIYYFLIHWIKLMIHQAAQKDVLK